MSADDPLAPMRVAKEQVHVPDFRDKFWAQVPDMRPTVRREPKATVNACRFDHANKRVYHYPGCEHNVGWGDDGEK
jgi:hypothetical protein